MGEITWGTAAATLIAPLVFLLPGWALLSLLVPPELCEAERRPDAASWLALASGLTLALVPVLLLILDLLGLRIGMPAVLAGLALSGGVVVWRRGPIWLAWWCRTPSWRDRFALLDTPLLTLILTTALVLGVRLWVVRGINIGLWGDSYHHTVITQLLLDNGGLFQSWEPYVPLKSFAYHFGFHADAAFFHWASGWLSGNATPRTVVLVGQFVNVMAVLALYPLTVRLCRGNRWAGVTAVLVAGLLAPMPMMYANWGRYTQLAGQAILPVAMWFTMEALEARGRVGGWLAVAALAVAGLALTHYRILVLYAAFLVPYLPYLIWRGRREGRWLAPVWRIAVIGVMTLVLAVPWLWNLWKGYYARIAAGFIEQKLPTSWISEVNSVGEMDFYMPYWLMIVAGVGAVWGVWRRRMVVLVVPWVAVVFLLTNPHLVGLPGTGLMTNFTIALALYIPVSILAGYLVGESLAWLARWRKAGAWAAMILVLGVGIWGVRAQAGLLDLNHQLVTPADEQAMAWIRENTPPDARFLVNGFFAYNDSVLVGSDAGWWIPLLAGRKNTVPPMLYRSEASFVPDYRSQVDDLLLELRDMALDDPNTVRFLQGQGISHIYIGEKGGSLLNPQELERSSLYHTVYHQDSVWIFEINPERK